MPVRPEAPNGTATSVVMRDPLAASTTKVVPLGRHAPVDEVKTCDRSVIGVGVISAEGETAAVGAKVAVGTAAPIVGVGDEDTAAGWAAEHAKISTVTAVTMAWRTRRA